MATITVRSLLKFAFLSLTKSTTVYFGLLGLLIAVPSFRTHAFYLYRVTLTWFNDLNVPEIFDFLPNQVMHFSIGTADGEKLHTWHVHPLGIYRRNQRKLLAQPLRLYP